MPTSIAPAAGAELAASGTPLDRLLRDPGRRSRLTHVESVPARPGRTADWPTWVPPLIVDRLTLAGIPAPWEHQVAAAELAAAGRSVVLATGTASGKSLGYLLPVLSALVEGGASTALYLAPTKALAADQLRAVRRLNLTAVRAGTYDGDTPPAERDWVRAHANLVLTNPDMLHRSLLPGHARWATYLRRLQYVVVDECHGYRGVFGSHVAQVVRRLRRLCEHYGASPTFVLASATVSEPAASAGRLVGVPVEEVTEDAAPRGAADFALWEPPLLDAAGQSGGPVRRAAGAEAADLLADLVVEGSRTLAFGRSRRGAEAMALAARRALLEAAPELAHRVAAYRAGYLPEERRALEAALQRGDLLGLATTSALELGVDVAGLDAVVLAGFPGRVASVRQQAGRAGRAGRPALAVLVASDDPLDTYLVHHPEALFGRPVEATVLDPDNPYVLRPHLCAAAAELPLTEADLARFGPAAEHVVADLVERGMLRRRPAGWFWTRRERACDLADIRGIGGPSVRLVEASTGRLLGTVDGAAAHSTVHDGAVYLHQGESYVVASLDLADGVALVEPDDPDYFTSARDRTDIAVVESLAVDAHPLAELHFGTVDVTSQVVGYLRRRLLTGEVVAEVPLELPPRQLRTRAVWWTVAPALLERAGLELADVSGAAHAAEHAPRSACCRSLPPATAGTSAACRPPCTSTPAGRPSSPTTAAQAVPASPSEATWRVGHGCAPPGMRSLPAVVRRAALPASSHPSAATAILRWTRREPAGCSARSWTSSARHRGNPADDRVSDPDVGAGLPAAALYRKGTPMAVLGLLLMLAAGVLTAGVVLSNTNQISAEAFGVTLSNVSVGGIFVAGAVTALIFALGLWMLLQGMRRARRRRLERREIVRDTRDQTASLAAEKDRLEKELEAERARRASTPPVVTERTVVEREPVAGDTAVGPPEGSERVNDRPRLFRR